MSWIFDVYFQNKFSPRKQLSWLIPHMLTHMLTFENNLSLLNVIAQWDFFGQQLKSYLYTLGKAQKYWDFSGMSENTLQSFNMEV